jgi:hypothetical protein
VKETRAHGDACHVDEWRKIPTALWLLCHVTVRRYIVSYSYSDTTTLSPLVQLSHNLLRIVYSF